MKPYFDRIEKLFRTAEKKDRSFFLEHEVYNVLKELGIRTPDFLFVEKGKEVKKDELSSIRSPKVVIKIVSPYIFHKSDVGGVKLVSKNVREVNQTIQKMLKNVPENCIRWSGQRRNQKGLPSISLDQVKKGILGVLVCEEVDFEKVGFGSELLMGLRSTREFGPVLTVGIGGVDVEFLHKKLRLGKASSIASVHLFQKKDIPKMLKSLAFYDKLTGVYRGRKPLISSKELENIYQKFQRLGRYFSPFNNQSEYVIEEAEVNPFVVSEKKLVPLDGTCRFSRKHKKSRLRPLEQIHHLLHPRTLAIIGVSEKMNTGHIILNNVLRQGFSKSRIYVVKPGVSEMEGCPCVPSVSEIPQCVDLFILAVSADQSYKVMREAVEMEKARSAIIISGGIGEKAGTYSLEKDIKSLLESGRKKGKKTPVVNGGNCLGIYSRPGKYDTTFIPKYKLYHPPRKDVFPSKLAYISQSGAFMISRMSKIPYIDPVYAISVGNQIDLSIPDYLNYLRRKEEVQIIAVYVEGFLPSEGLTFVRTAQEMVREGKKILVYKAGRSQEGQNATSTHTASVAGNYRVTRWMLEQSGVILADSLLEFENNIRNLCFLKDKPIKGSRVGLISNAGFECVIMSDNLENEKKLKLARFSPQTMKKLSQVLEPLGIDRLQDIKNPLDVTPVADDLTFSCCVQLILEDPGVDCAVVSPVPMTPAMQTLETSPYHKENVTQKGSIALRLVDVFRKTDKPFVVNIDSGVLYNPMAELLEKSGVPTFRRCDEAVKFLRQFCFQR
ncbi:acetate--CoA ligase family protein [bacterium]|nr:acetate--CoA ligase family protein [bacterium]